MGATVLAMHRRSVHRFATALGCASVLAFGCGDDTAYLPIDELLKPEACQKCHPVHFQEWASSMHAYAADDPMFLALNARGQKDTNGALGSFCVNCHAPIALQLGLTSDGLNLPSVPQWAKGVTCYFCHNVKAVEGSHNNPLVLFNDAVMRGGLADPLATNAHGNAYSSLVDADHRDSSKACGACHDIVTPAGVHLERTYSEWQESIFSHDDPRTHLSCGQCHMIATDGKVASIAGAKIRSQGVREHTFAGIDVALTPWPDVDLQKRAIDRDLKAVLAARLCVLPTNGGEITLRLDNVGAGHRFPSGAAHDRRAWAEVIAYNAAGEQLFASGVVAADQDPDLSRDPSLFAMWDKTYNGDAPANFFWDVTRVESMQLRAAVTTDIASPNYDHSTTKAWTIGAVRAQIARVTAVVKIRPMPVYLFGLLGPEGITAEHLAAMPTFELSGTRLEWTPQTAVNLCVE